MPPLLVGNSYFYALDSSRSHGEDLSDTVLRHEQELKELLKKHYGYTRCHCPTNTYRIKKN